MKSGRFFKAESDIGNTSNENVFWYIPVVANYEEKEAIPPFSSIIAELGLDKSAYYKHPIFVTFGRNTIKCYARYLDNNGQTHLNTIFVLPTNAPKKLNRILRAIYSEEIELLGNYKYRSEYENYINSSKNPMRNIAYWNIDHFNIKKDFSNRNIITEKLKVSIRKIFLDFLFDLKHFSVFRESPYYEDLFFRLEENAFFQAISHKAAYYYKERLLNSIKEQILHEDYSDEYKDNLIKSFWKEIENLNVAENNWLNTITDNNAGEIIKQDSSWFENTEIEYSTVFQLKRQIDSYKKQIKWHQKSKTRLKSSLKLFLKDIQKQDSFTGKQSNIEHINKSIDWLSKRYAVLKAAIIQLDYVSTPFNKTAFCLFFLFSVSYLSGFYPLNNSFIIQYFFTLYSFVISFIFSLLLSHSLSDSLPRVVGFFYPSILFISIVVWYLIGRNPILWDLAVEFDWVYSGICLFIFIILILILYVQFSTFKIQRQAIIYRVITLVIIALIYSSFVGIVIMSNSAERVLMVQNTLYNYYHKIPTEDLSKRLNCNLDNFSYSKDDAFLQRLNSDTSIIKNNIVPDSTWSKNVLNQSISIQNRIEFDISFDFVPFEDLKQIDLLIQFPLSPVLEDSIQLRKSSIWKSIQNPIPQVEESQYIRHFVESIILSNPNLVKEFIYKDIEHIMKDKASNQAEIFPILFSYLKYVESKNGLHPIMIEEEIILPMIGKYKLRIFSGILFFNVFVTLAIGILNKIAFRDRPVI